MSWMQRPKIDFARTKTGRVTHVGSGRRTVCGIASVDLSARSDAIDFFKLPLCGRCVDGITAQLDHATGLAEKVYAAAHRYGKRTR